ncbi:N-acetylglutaminylglutamine amidotransferase [Sinimarinibacterium flocculans]|uniref:asparagine synthase (glutamine-hydrolyzing) n=1 Tax=Sinimarinibacterium flocculans TaxID=985250 RepID=A0A318E3C2_9GAMM|nr:N-acetylglutaminylglutamine amidotransferase [Sinimarinibacterium flocculans]PXV64600.1 asparagine synthase (glutamine-hydrolysing) [Sinimarinibacterium flocculans]
MCGFAGERRYDGRLADTDAVAAMTATMARRGPDGAGTFSTGPLAVGHRRLKIMDLSEHAQQPMLDNELGLGIVYNGAVYNHPELRAELKAKGYRFWSEGDTEVLLKAYHCWGADFVQRLHGMFAFAIWERDSGRLLLGRDRLGIKPLYYSLNDKRLRFASTLPALLKAKDVDTDIDPVALHHYLHFHAVVPAPHTMLKGVRKLAPATLMVVEPDGQTRQRRYWQPDYARNAEESRRSFEDWRDMTLAALRTAVKRRLVADIPVGALLSGGVDSSLIVGLMSEADANVRTYSIGFEDVGSEEGNEFRYSDIIAKHYATQHERIFIDSRTLLPRLPEALAAMSEPMVSHDCVAFYLLSEAVSKHSKVVQSGQGADEVFGGYHWYPPMLETQDALATYDAAFCDRSHEEFLQVVDPRMATGDHSRDFIRAHFAQAGAPEPIDQALRLDTTIMLVDDPVKRVDNMTMAWGLEARVPFLDHELVEIAARIPGRHKIAQGGKHVLKEAARQVIPAAVIDRPKGYFPVPALKYLQGDFLDYARSLLDATVARDRGLFRREYVETLYADPEAHITPLRGSKLWQLAALEGWLQAHGI